MTTKTSPLLLKIKNEVANEEIKEYAESAMNELLGWYGYGDNERMDVPKNMTRNYSNSTRMSGPLENSSISSVTSTLSLSGRRKSSSTEERDCGTTSPDSSKSITNKLNGKSDDCGWCKRPVSLYPPNFLVTPEGARYCTESCFSQSRRASFKRAKTCDWCKHIRHAVSYVDFQDGASQLQFCSDKCLNQYKMQIFCKETQAHLDMNPHLKDNNGVTSKNLITPDLWLKNCRSRSASPISERSQNSPSPSMPLNSNQIPVVQPVATISMPKSVVMHRPIISVTPTSKLLPSPAKNILALRFPSPIARHSRRRRSLRLNTTNGAFNSHINNNSNNNNSSSNNNNNNINNNNNNNNINNNNSANIKNNNMKLNLLNSSNIAKELNIRSSETDININSSTLKSDKSLQSNPMSNFNYLHAPQNMYHANSNPVHGDGPASRFVPPFIGPTAMPPVTPSSMFDGAIPRLFGSAQQPPVTILVPYPIVLPFPIPIPIPLPLDVLLKAAQLKLKSDNPNETSPASTSKSIGVADASYRLDTRDTNSPSPDQPLDFTKAKETESTPSTIQTYFNESDGDSGTEAIQPTITSIDSMNREQIDENQMSDNDHCEPRLPKFKITRLNSRRAFAKESESSRPLRKRKRIIDCDYLHLKDGK